MDQDSGHIAAVSKVPMLKPENSATLPKTQVVEGVTTMVPITSVEDKTQRRLEVKARSTLMIEIPNEHQLKFNSTKDAKQLLEAIKKRFGGNAATKKTRRKLLKQYQNLLRSLSQEWNTYVAVWRNKADMDTMSMDDLYNNLKVYEPEVKGMSNSNSNTQNMNFVSFTNSSTNRVVNTAQAVNTANGVSTASTQFNAAFSTNIDNLSDAIICAFLASQPNSPQLTHEDLEQINPDDMEEMDLGWKRAMLTIRDKRGHFARECRALRNQDNKHKESRRRSVPVETPASTDLVSCDDIAIKELRQKLDVAQKEKDGIQLNIDKFENASKGLNKLIECHIIDNCKKGLGYQNYNAVLPPYTGNFMPPKPDLFYTGLDEFAVKPIVENKSSEEKTKADRKNIDASIIEEWVSDDKEKNVTQSKIVNKQLGQAC
nr:hypothetical protein [Tanacetum cinerariifolium]